MYFLPIIFAYCINCQLIIDSGKIITIVQTRIYNYFEYRLVETRGSYWGKMNKRSISSIVDIRDGNAFEKVVHELLGMKYGSGNYQMVPDRHLGDKGIEGFTLDGFAFQCYAPEGNYDAKMLYEHQRDKMSNDINKFIENAPDLNRLSPTKFSRWFFIIPEFNSRLLINHARNKEKEVISKNLVHVDADFKIIIPDANIFFNREIEERCKLLLPNIIETREITQNDANTWIEAEPEQMNTLVRKLNKINGISPNLQSLAIYIILQYIKHQDIMDTLNSSSPEIHERILHLISTFESKVKFKSMTGIHPEGSAIVEEAEKFNEALSSELSEYVGLANREEISSGVVAGWLINCPLDFTEVEH